jgi:hypothetical protein
MKGETTFDLEHLERKIATVFTPADDGSCISTMVDVLCRILHEEKVLPNLRAIQQMDYLDIGTGSLSGAMCRVRLADTSFSLCVCLGRGYLLHAQEDQGARARRTSKRVGRDYPPAL